MSDVTPSDVTASVSDLSAVPTSDPSVPPASVEPTIVAAECQPLAPQPATAPEGSVAQPTPQGEALPPDQVAVPATAPAADAPAQQSALSVPRPPAVDELCAELKPDQVRAMQHIIAGLTIPDAAVAAGVGRRTLYRWCNEDPLFAAALNLWKREQFDSAQSQALGAVGPAMRTIVVAAGNGNVAAAMQLIKGLGVLAPVKLGETDPSRIRRKRRLASYRKEKKLAEAEYKHEVNHLYRVDSVAAWDQRLGEELAERDCFTEREENLWRMYELTLHLTEEECREMSWRKHTIPPKCPRPSAAQALAANERFSARAGWNVADHANAFLERGRLAAEAAKGRQQALQVLEILRARNAGREEQAVE